MLSQLLVVFGFFSLVLVSVYWVNRAVRLFDMLIADGQTVLVFLEFSALALPNVISRVLPISAFAATVYVVNRLSSESELIVMQSNGMSSFRLARPVLVFGLIVALVLVVLMHLLMPANRALLSDRQDEIAQNITGRMLTEGDFVHPANGITVYIGSITEDGALEHVFLSDDRARDRRTDYTARRAVLVPEAQGPKLVMLDGMAQILDRDSERMAVMRFDDLTYDVGRLIATTTRSENVEALSTAALLRAAPSDLEATGASRAAFLHEAWTRIAHPFLAVVAALIGYASLRLGAFSRFGFWRQITGAVGLLIVVQFINNSLAGMALRDAALAPLAFGPVAVGAVMAVTMLWLADRPRRPIRAPRRAAPAGRAGA